MENDMNDELRMQEIQAMKYPREKKAMLFLSPLSLLAVRFWKFMNNSGIDFVTDGIPSCIANIDRVMAVRARNFTSTGDSQSDTPLTPVTFKEITIIHRLFSTMITIGIVFNPKFA